MAKRKRRLGFEIDKLTSSIENTLTGEEFETDIIRLYPSDKALIKKKDWQFDCGVEISDSAIKVYALVTTENPEIFQGLVGLLDDVDHMFIKMIASRRIN